MNESKRARVFVFKLTILFFVCYFCWYLYILLFPMFYNMQNNNRWYFLRQSLNNNITIPESDILFLGDSRVNAGIDFNQINNCYSLAEGGTTSIEIFYMLKKYLVFHKTPKTIFLSISPRFQGELFSFYPYCVRNDFFTFSEFHEITSNLGKNDTTLGKYPNVEFLLNKFRWIPYYQGDVYKNYGFFGYSLNKAKIAEMVQLKGASFHEGLLDSCSLPNYETRYKNHKISPILDLYFDKIFRLCEQNNIELIFDFMPMNKSSFQKLNTIFVSEYKKYMLKYSKKYPKFCISDTVYFYDDVYFGDESHLNSKGKEIFTYYLKTKYFYSK